MNRKAVVYARVSTDDQVDRGYSLGAQLGAGRSYAEARGIDVVSEQVDDGVSGATAFSERPAGSAAWAMLRNGQADALIVQNVDRLSRDVVDLLVTIRELLRAGVEVHCLDLGRVESEYDIMLVIRGWQGSDERAKIRERSARGKREKLAQGLVIAGVVPFGYDFLRDEQGRIVGLEVIPEQARLVKLIFQWYTQGDEEGNLLSLYAIAKRLTEAGVATPRKSKSGRALWYSSTIARMLRNTTYKGVSEYQVSAAGNGEELFKVEVPALVDAATWEAAQAQKIRNSDKAARNSRRFYLLRSIITCGCDHSMVGKSKSADGKRYFYYTCSARCHPLGAVCSEPSQRAERLEAMVWDYFVEIITNPATFEKYLREAQVRELEAQNPKRLELETVTALIDEAEAEAVKLGEALTKARGIVAKTLEDKMTALNERYDRLTARQAELEAALTQKLTDEGITAAIRFAHDVERGLETASTEHKRRILDLFDTQIKVKDGRVFLTHSVQSEPIELPSPPRSPSARPVPRPRRRR